MAIPTKKIIALVNKGKGPLRPISSSPMKASGSATIHLVGPDKLEVKLSEPKDIGFAVGFIKDAGLKIVSASTGSIVVDAPDQRGISPKLRLALVKAGLSHG